MTKARVWKASKDPLFRGDCQEEVTRPVPAADRSIVRHVLYLDGAGRATPYVSTTESALVAERFAGKSGRVWETTVPKARSQGVDHRGRTELLSLLKGKGKGDCTWHSAFEVMNARRYVEEWQEHLLDFGSVGEGFDIETLLSSIFE